MPPPPRPGALPDPADLLSKLREIRSEHQESEASERIRALQAALSEELGKVPDNARAGWLGELRTLALVQAADGSAHQGPRETSQGMELRLSAERALAERDALAQRVLALERECESLRQNPPPSVVGDVLAEPPAAGQPRKVGSRDAPGIDKLREVLRRAVRGVRISPEDSGLVGAEAQVLRLTSELVRFILELTKKRQLILSELYAGPGGGMQTLLINQQNEQIRKLLLDIVEENPKASIEQLVEALKENDRFLFGIGSALIGSMPQALKDVVAALDPEVLLEKHRGRFVTNYESAWKDYQRTHNDLANLTPLEIYERFFKKPILEKFEPEK